MNNRLKRRIEFTGYINEFWGHSTRIVQAAKDIARLEKPETAEVAFTAGLVHDIGGVVIAGNAPRDSAATRNCDGLIGGSRPVSD